jgi:DNA-binding NarL/FixJ family response regulator
MKDLRILVVDDHDVVRRGLRAFLEAHPGWKVVGEAVNGRDAVEMAKQLKPDVTVMDIRMPEMDGLEATRSILETAPLTAVLIFTLHRSQQMVQEAVRAGARGYVLKSDTSSNLIAAVEALSRHETFFTSYLGNSSSKVA